MGKYKKKRNPYRPPLPIHKFKYSNKTKFFFKHLFKSLTCLQKRDLIIKLNMPITLTDLQQKVIELRLQGISWYDLENKCNIFFATKYEYEALQCLKFRYLYLIKQNMLDNLIFKKDLKI